MSTAVLDVKAGVQVLPPNSTITQTVKHPYLFVVELDVVWV